MAKATTIPGSHVSIASNFSSLLFGQPMASVDNVEVEMSEMNRIKVVDLNPFLTCGICHGYLHCAVTITECLHSFCKPCLVKHVKYNLRCPSCGLLIHPTDPLVHIRLDSTIQDIVYKLLPNVEQEEIRREAFFYENTKPENPTATSLVTPKMGSIYSSRKKHFNSSRLLGQVCDERPTSPPPPTRPKLRAVALEFAGRCMDTGRRRPIKPLDNKYLLLSGQVRISSIANFLYKKLDLSQTAVQVCLFAGLYLLNASLRLDEVADIFVDVNTNVITLHYGILPINDYLSEVNKYNVPEAERVSVKSCHSDSKNELLSHLAVDNMTLQDNF